MHRRRFLIQSTLAAGAATIPWTGKIRGEAQTSWAGYSSAIVIDGCGAPGGGSFGDRVLLTGANVADVKASGLTAINITVGGVGSYTRDFEEALKNIAFWDSEIQSHPDALMQVKTSADLDAAKKSGRCGLIYGFQDATPYGESLDRFDLFHGLGIRIVQLTYNLKNLVGDGCLEPRNAGLSLFGQKLVSQMNEKRILVDLSHCGERTTVEGIERSSQPVAITHAGCRAIADLPRNKTDDTLRTLADKGGVVGIYLMPFLRTAGQPMASDVIEHIDHAVNVCGEDHVGIGTDGPVSMVNVTDEYRENFKKEIADRRQRGISAPGEREDAFTFVPDLNSPKRFEMMASLLSKRGYSDTRISKIVGGNFNRLLRDVWG